MASGFSAHLTDKILFGTTHPIAVIGGGGKSRLLKMFANAITSYDNTSCIFTTTTKMQLSEAQAIAADAVYGVSSYPQLLDILNNCRSNNIFLHCGESQQKVLGIPASWIDSVQRDCPQFRIIYEADGSRRLPLKLHRSGEPVLANNSYVICVVGMSALGSHLDAVAHGAQLAPAHVLDGKYVSVATIVHIAEHALDNIAHASGKLILLNQSDVITDYEALQVKRCALKYPTLLGNIISNEYIILN